MPFHSNRALLSAIFSNFKADNNCVFKIFLIYFGTFPPYYRVFFRLFGPKIIVLLIFSLGKRRIVRFLAWIAFYYWEFLKLFWHIISVILSIFTFFFTFFRYHFTQIAPYYRSLFRILRPIISVFVTIFLIYFGIFPLYFNATHFWVLSISSWSVHLAHQIDVRKSYPHAFYVEKMNLLL